MPVMWCVMVRDTILKLCSTAITEDLCHSRTETSSTLARLASRSNRSSSGMTTGHAVMLHGANVDAATAMRQGSSGRPCCGWGEPDAILASASRSGGEGKCQGQYTLLSSL